jgi:hypothetical protein
LDQPVEFRRYIRTRYQVVATLASQTVISAASWGSGQKPKEGQGKLPVALSRPSRKASGNAVTQQMAWSKPQRTVMPCHLGAEACPEVNSLEKDVSTSNRCPQSSE